MAGISLLYDRRIEPENKKVRSPWGLQNSLTGFTFTHHSHLILCYDILTQLITQHLRAELIRMVG